MAAAVVTGSAAATTDPVVAHGTQPARIVNADSVKLPGRDWGYAYGPAIVKTTSGGTTRYHAFVCSTGETGGTIDKIRYTYSDNGLNWSAPVVEISASGPKGTLDYSACDPSIVQYGGEWEPVYFCPRRLRGGRPGAPPARAPPRPSPHSVTAAP